MKEYWNCMFAGILVCLALFITRHSEALTVKPFIYHQDFENGIDPMKFVSARGKYTLNFQGITDEQAFSGKKSFKIDIILDAGGSYTLAIPLDDIPVVDNLKFSGMIRVAEAPPRSPVVLGLDFRYWPCLMETSGTRDFPWNTKYDDWVKISADIPYRAHGQASKFHYFPELFWAVEPENTGIYVARIFLTLFTRATGDITRRFIVYVDDLKIEGEVPDKDEFKKDTEQRWKQVSEKTEKKILEWEGAIKEAEAQISKLTNLSPEAEKLKTELEKKIKENDVRTMPEIKEARKNGYLRGVTYRKIEAFTKNLPDYFANIKTLTIPETIQKTKKSKCLIYMVNPTQSSENRILPGMVLLPGRLSDEIRITACAGEYEPASFAIHALDEIKGLQIKAEDLTGAAGKISSSNIDIKVVKCWYQEEPGRGRILMPELLLNDENLVQVDEEKKISRIRFNTPEGPKYLAYGEPGWQDYPDRKTQTPFWVSNDSGTLLPVDIQASTNKQFWITVKVPEEAKPGQYQGKINLISDGSTLKELNLILSVLPFKLSAPYYQTSVWVHEGANSIEKRYRNMVKNQIEHGITVLMSHLNLRDVDEFTLWEKTLKIRQEIRVPTEILLLAEHPLIYRELAGASHKGLTRIDITEEKKKRFIEGYQKYRELANSYGYKEIWFYMADERDGKELEAWLPVYELVRQIGAKSMTANHIGRTFEIAGGKHDVFVCENGVTKKEADRWHAAGEKIWATWTPSGGVEDFEVNRRNHGLLVWKAGYDGVTEYLYGKENGWVEAASTTTGAAGDGIYNMVYLTTDGIIDTIQWEGFREAVDDVRYITTLEKLVAQAKKSGKKQKEVTAAEKYLESIDAKYGNLDEIRNNVIEHILKLR